MQNKIFNIAAEFNLTKSPDWLDNFRKKYDKPYKYHITLKLATYFNNNDTKKLKKELEVLTKKYKKIKVVFDKIFTGPDPIKDCIMIKSKNNSDLMNLQKEIKDTLSKYGRNIKKTYENYETNFEPHITIGRSLGPEEFKNAMKDLGKEIDCETTIKEIILTIIKNDNFEEWSDPKNKTSYKLKNQP